KRNTAKRGGGQANLSLDEEAILTDERADEMLALDEALTRLETVDERLARIVEYRYFGGLTIEETAEVLAISPATVKRDWRTAKAWLYRELNDDT
ncbi:MAG: ECF-type sigma factor, partial [Rhodothermales bacterium]